MNHKFRPSLMCDTCISLLWGQDEPQLLTIGGGGQCAICGEFTPNHVYEKTAREKLQVALTAELTANSQSVRTRPQPGEPTDMPVFDRLTRARARGF